MQTPRREPKPEAASAAPPRVLFVYYSFTQQTRRVAETMAAELRGRGCPVTVAAIEFSDPRYGKRFARRPMSWPLAKIVGMLPAQAMRKTGDVRIPAEASEGDYDLVVIGSPTWWLTTCMPIRSYLHDAASQRILAGKAFAAFTTSRRYYRGNLGTIRRLGERAGGTFVGDTHFVSDGNQVMSMWSWLAFMRHDVEKQRSLGVHLPKPNLKSDYEARARDFISATADKAQAGHVSGVA